MDQIGRIEECVRIFCTISPEEQELLEYSIKSVIDRTCLFLRADKLDQKYERIVADVVSGVFNKYKNDKKNDYAAQVQTLSDNGQSITYATTMRNFLLTASDDELFSGAINILKPYRKVKVVGHGTTK